MIRPSGFILIIGLLVLSIALFVAIGILARPHWTDPTTVWDAYHAKLRTLALMFLSFWAGVCSLNLWTAFR